MFKNRKNLPRYYGRVNCAQFVGGVVLSVVAGREGGKLRQFVRSTEHDIIISTPKSVSRIILLYGRETKKKQNIF